MSGWVENGALKGQNFMFSGMCGDSVQSNAGVSLTAGADWRGRRIQITMVFGATTSSGKGLRLMIDSASLDDSADWI